MTEEQTVKKGLIDTELKNATKEYDNLSKHISDLQEVVTEATIKSRVAFRGVAYSKFDSHARATEMPMYSVGNKERMHDAILSIIKDDISAAKALRIDAASRIASASDELQKLLKGIDE